MVYDLWFPDSGFKVYDLCSMIYLIYDFITCIMFMIYYDYIKLLLIILNNG